MKKWAIVICISLLYAQLPAQDLLLKNGVIYTFDKGVLTGHDLLIQQGKIVSIDKEIPAPEGVTVLDLKGQSVIPGLIDSHNHVGLTGGINEGRENITPEVRMEYQINPDDTRLYYCLTGGVTMTHTMHGSANPIGGQNVTIKLKWGKSAAEMWEKRAWRTLKMALGENPKRLNYPSNFPSSRMGTSYAIKEAFDKAQVYRKEWQDYNLKLKNTPRKNRLP